MWFWEADSRSSDPFGGGEIWDSFSNADSQFSRAGTRSKHVSKDKVPGESNFDPDKMFLGKEKKGCKTTPILGGQNGTNQ